MVSTKRAADDAGTQAPKKHKSDGAAASSNSGNPNGGMQPPKHRDAKKPGWNKGEKSWNKKVQNGVKEAIPHRKSNLTYSLFWPPTLESWESVQAR